MTYNQKKELKLLSEKEEKTTIEKKRYHELLNLWNEEQEKIEHEYYIAENNYL